MRKKSPGVLTVMVLVPCPALHVKALVFNLGILIAGILCASYQ